MDLSFVYFWEQVTSNPLLMLAVGLTLGVIFVNGWTDCPNAIATCVTTRCMEARPAILMSAFFNFLGVFIMSSVNATVAQTIANMVDFGTNSHDAIVALSAALLAIVIWAVLAWYFGIPTSESHALIAGLTGAAIAMHGGLSGVNGHEWIKVIYGLVISVVLGFILGYAVCKLVTVIFFNVDRRKTEGIFRNGQIGAACAMSFMHGAQDGQKFMGVILMCLLLSNGGGKAVQSKCRYGSCCFVPSSCRSEHRSAARRSSNPSAWIWSNWKNIRAFRQIWQLPSHCSSARYSVFLYRRPMQKQLRSWVSVLSSGLLRSISALSKIS